MTSSRKITTHLVNADLVTARWPSMGAELGVDHGDEPDWPVPVAVWRRCDLKLFGEAGTLRLPEPK